MKAMIEVDLLKVKGTKVTKELENSKVEASFLKMLQPFIKQVPKVLKKNGVEVFMTITIKNG
jgi:hypothetical protein